MSWTSSSVLRRACGGLTIAVLASACAVTQAEGLMPATEREALLVVTGEATESVETERTEIRLGVGVQHPTAQEANAEAAARTSRVVDVLKKAKVESLSTTGITLNPQYDYKNGRRLTGYIANNRVVFEVATEEAGPLLDKVVEVGATEVQGIRFVALPDKLAAAEQRALAAAALDARKQADVVLAALGLQRTAITSVRVGNASAPPPQPVLRQARMSAEAASTPVEGGEQTVRATVTLEVSYVAGGDS